MDKYALVTGASKGIGKEIAIQLAELGYHLLLVARSETELSSLASLIQEKYQVKVHYLSNDLSMPGSSYRVAEWCTEHTSNFSILVNNAGFGIFGQFDTLKLDEQMEMIRLNVNAVVELTHILLPRLHEQNQAYILNICSTAAYQAMPAMAIYAATKSFILSFTRALRYELKDSNVSVTCLSPGPTDTGFASRAGLDMLAELADNFNMSPGTVARIGLHGMFQKKAEIIPGFINKLSAAGATFLPKRLVERISASIYKK
ncbi:SDR family NAD(P)-dependent oxidoreductase [Pedobacter sp. PWIIR3]